ncbi:MAG: primosomal protein N', partial [Muribaculaceae bacterium]|nr:primosomal protein N' [Muribaculaceae bacterium]
MCEIYNKEISRFSYSGPPACPKPELSDHQARALRQIHHQFREKDIVLLHGVTGSGKTEIYIHLIDFVLEQGRQALFLVPEIALTTQLTRRLQRVFGDKVMIYHSKFSDNERVELWRSMLQSNAPRVVIGARSAVFLPFSDLGLVIVDEEHETSYKQFDPAPRYNARDAATVLASMHGAKTLFGSATPTVETYHKALSGKFGLVELSERFSGARLPAIEIVDMKRERGRKAVAGYFSHRLLDLTNESLGRNYQTILFHNRRGYAPMARCKLCGFTPKCNFCDVSLTYHRRFNRLQCHYCGTDYSVQQLCPECHEPTMEIVGYGTERLEEELAESFPQRKILRMDLDTTRNKDSYGKIIDDFSQHKADILVGTQMVTKGLDFDSVEIVGILNADSLINYPDFRAAERAFNMIEQVAGRAGRRNVEGRVIIQTYNPAHPILSYAASHDYKGFFEHELEERRAFSFPPFSKIINIYLRHRDQHTVNECATLFATSLRNIFGSRISGPIEPDVARVSSMYIRKIMLKIETNASMKRVK